VGLDTVELVMAVEEDFNLEIPDAAAEKMFTVGDMHSFVVSELRRRGKQTLTKSASSSDYARSSVLSS
jgi:hypothetical protein